MIVGAGFAGLYMLHKLRGLWLAAQVIEAGDGVGGTWDEQTQRWLAETDGDETGRARATIGSMRSFSLPGSTR